jgi:hypothetical protein
VYCYASIVLYEAVLGGMPGYRSLAGQLTDMPAMPRASLRQRYDWPTAASAAMAVAADRLFPTASAPTRDEFADLRTVQIAERAAKVSPDIHARSLAHGEAIGNAVMDWAGTDGLSVIRALPTYVPVIGIDKWVSTPPNFGTAIKPYWGQIRPFALPAADVCKPPPPIPYSEEPSSEFYAQARTVYETQKALTDEQKFIAMFWRDNPVTSGLPSGHWMNTVSQLIDQLGLRLDDAAEAYARLGIALADAFISCWREKYETNLLRPITYINRVIDPSLAT